MKTGKRGRPVGATTRRLTKIEMETFIKESVKRIMGEHLSWTEYTRWCMRNSFSEVRCNEYWKKSWESIREKYEVEKDKQVTKHLHKLWELYDTAIRNNDLTNARQCLNDIAKLMGLNEAEKINLHQTGEINFKFGDE